MASTSSRSYDVFLSFIGVDTRDSFTAHLCRQLCRNGINTFLDDEGLERGQVITPALVTAIENSKVSIVVLSENFASSRWFLEELVKILECRRTKGQRLFQFSIISIHQMCGIKGENLEKPWLNMKRIWRIGKGCRFGGMLLLKLPIYLVGIQGIRMRLSLLRRLFGAFWKAWIRLR